MKVSMSTAICNSAYAAREQIPSREKVKSRGREGDSASYSLPVQLRLRLRVPCSSSKSIYSAQLPFDDLCHPRGFEVLRRAPPKWDKMLDLSSSLSLETLQAFIFMTFEDPNPFVLYIRDPFDKLP